MGFGISCYANCCVIPPSQFVTCISTNTSCTPTILKYPEKWDACRENAFENHTATCDNPDSWIRNVCGAVNLLRCNVVEDPFDDSIDGYPTVVTRYWQGSAFTDVLSWANNEASVSLVLQLQSFVIYRWPIPAGETPNSYWNVTELVADYEKFENMAYQNSVKRRNLEVTQCTEDDTGPSEHPAVYCGYIPITPTLYQEAHKDIIRQIRDGEAHPVQADFTPSQVTVPLDPIPAAPTDDDMYLFYVIFHASCYGNNPVSGAPALDPTGAINHLATVIEVDIAAKILGATFQ